MIFAFCNPFSSSIVHIFSDHHQPHILLFQSTTYFQISYWCIWDQFATRFHNRFAESAHHLHHHIIHQPSNDHYPLLNLASKNAKFIIITSTSHSIYVCKRHYYNASQFLFFTKTVFENAFRKWIQIPIASVWLWHIFGHDKSMYWNLV
jgi:hypothetical protein